MDAPYDILKRDFDGTCMWVEAVVNLETAKAKIAECARKNPGEYLVFDQGSKLEVFKININST